MSREELQEIRDKDHAVLEHIDEGYDDVQKITSETTLENHHVSYSFQKLEQLNLIEVEKPDRMVERVINGQKRVFQHPKQAQLTEKGRQYLNQADQESTRKYEDIPHNELVQRVKTLEEEVEDLRESFQLFKKQIQDKL